MGSPAALLSWVPFTWSQPFWDAPPCRGWTEGAGEGAGGGLSGLGLGGVLEQGAGLGSAQGVLGAEGAVGVAVDHAGGVGGQHRVVIPPVQGGEVLDLGGLGGVIPPGLGQEGLHQDFHRQLAGDGLVEGLPGGGDLVPVVPPGLERALELIRRPVGGLPLAPGELCQPDGHRHELGGGDAGVGAEGAVRVALEGPGLGELGDGPLVPVAGGHVGEGGPDGEDEQGQAEGGGEQGADGFTHRDVLLCGDWGLGARRKLALEGVKCGAWHGKAPRPPGPAGRASPPARRRTR